MGARNTIFVCAVMWLLLATATASAQTASFGNAGPASGTYMTKIGFTNANIVGGPAKPAKASIRLDGDREGTIWFKEPDGPVSPGQSVVYRYSASRAQLIVKIAGTKYSGTITPTASGFLWLGVEWRRLPSKDEGAGPTTTPETPPLPAPSPSVATAPAPIAVTPPQPTPTPTQPTPTLPAATTPIPTPIPTPTVPTPTPTPNVPTPTPTATPTVPTPTPPTPSTTPVVVPPTAESGQEASAPATRLNPALIPGVWTSTQITADGRPLSSMSLQLKPGGEALLAQKNAFGQVVGRRTLTWTLHENKLFLGDTKSPLNLIDNVKVARHWMYWLGSFWTRSGS